MFGTFGGADKPDVGPYGMLDIAFYANTAEAGAAARARGIEAKVSSGAGMGMRTGENIASYSREIYERIYKKAYRNVTIWIR